MVQLDTERDDLINFTQFVWLINSERPDNSRSEKEKDKSPSQTATAAHAKKCK
jgi:hypothetical protein